MPARGEGFESGVERGRHQDRSLARKQSANSWEGGWGRARARSVCCCVVPFLRSVPRPAVKTARLAAGAWAAAYEQLPAVRHRRPLRGGCLSDPCALRLLRVATPCEVALLCMRRLRCGCEFLGRLRSLRGGAASPLEELPAADSCASHRSLERSPRSLRGGAASPLEIARLLGRIRRVQVLAIAPAPPRCARHASAFGGGSRVRGALAWLGSLYPLR